MVKKSFVLFFVLLLTVLFTVLGTHTAMISATTIQYQESQSDFPNPERGFFWSIDPIADQPIAPLQLTSLQPLKGRNLTLIRRLYLLAEFRNAPLSDALLKLIADDCATARKAGIKMIVRFTYNWVGGGADASRDRILQHLAQLQPVLQANADVIAYLESGFIGYWGEWNRSTHRLVDPWTLDVSNDAKAIFQKILALLPPDRMVAIRYPKQKQQIVGQSTPVTPTTAFNGSAQSRIGHHNDSFLANLDNNGTYSAADRSIVEREKAWLHLDTRYVVQGGEPAPSTEPTRTGSTSTEPMEADCRSALADLAQMHWSALSINQSDAASFYRRWSAQGCLQKIQRRLGYRFRLVKTVLPKVVHPGRSFRIGFTLTNQGWASPYNPRRVELILRHRATQQELRWTLNEDPRRWLAGESRNIEVNPTLPSRATPGVYDAFLNLPDPAPRLYGRPEYSIRLANRGTWEPATGYNSLLASLVVEAR